MDKLNLMLDDTWRPTGYIGNVIEQYIENEIVIITKDEAQALLTFLKDQWLEREIPHLNEAVQRLRVSLE